MSIALIRSAHCDEDHILGRPRCRDEKRCIEINDVVVFCLLRAPLEWPVSKPDRLHQTDVQDQLGTHPGTLGGNPLSGVEKWHREFASNRAPRPRNVSQVGPWQVDLCDDAPELRDARDPHEKGDPNDGLSRTDSGIRTRFC